MRKTLNNLQILRAFAAVNVVVFHIIGTGASYGFDVHYLKPLEGWGRNGVDIFFVLSGFIMVYILSDRVDGPLDFFIDRFTRIAPLYYFLSLLFFCLVTAAPQIFRSSAVSSSNLIASMFFISGLMQQHYPLLYDGWSLEYEMLFYVLITFALLFRDRAMTFVSVVLAICFSIIFLSLGNIAFEFLLGVFVGHVYLHTHPRSVVAVGALAGGILLLLLPIAVVPLNPVWSQQVIASGVPAMFVVYGLINIKQYKKSVLTSVGDASYSVYLIQVFTIPLFYKLIKLFNANNMVSSDIAAVMCCVFTVIVGWCVHKSLERPLTKGVRYLIHERFRNTGKSISDGAFR